MKKSLILSIFVSLIAFSSPASAIPDPAACLAAIGGGAGKTIKGLESEIQKTKKACKELRDCKYACRSDKKAAKRQIKNVLKACKAECKKLKKQGKIKGKAARQCSKGCKSQSKISKLDLKIKLSKEDKRNCQSSCKFPKDGQTGANKACFDARKDLARKATAAGLEEVGAIVGSCL
jgi:hypothetical protein